MSRDTEKGAARASILLLTGADGEAVEIASGDWYMNTKARARRKIVNSLSSVARQIDACLELHTMAYKCELAVKMVGGKRVLLTPADVISEAGISPRDFRRGMDELKAAGLGERRGADDGPLHKGKVELYSWGIPRAPQVAEMEAARAPFPGWFPFEEDSPMAVLVKRLKLSLLPDLEEAARAPFLEELKEAARKWEEDEKEVIALLKGVSAQAKSAPLRERNERNSERKLSAAAAVASDPPPAAAAAARPPAPYPDEMPIDPIVAAFAAIRGGITDSKARQLRRDCGGATPEEIAAKTAEFLGVLRNQRGLRNPAGLLIHKLMEFFHSPDALKQWRREREIAAEETAAREQREAERVEANRRDIERWENQAETDKRTDAAIAAMGPEAFEKLLRPKIAQIKKENPKPNWNWTEAALRATAEREVRRDLEAAEKAKGATP